MVNATLLASIAAFLITLIAAPVSIRYLRKIGLTDIDMNKKDKPVLPRSGGVIVSIGLFMGIMTYIFIQTFFFMQSANVIFLLAAVISIATITFIGFIDDLLGAMTEKTYKGLKQWQKPLLVLPAAIPLMVVNSGIDTMHVPLIGNIHLGLLYPLLLIPVAVVGAGNMVNLLAGFNGLETGMGLVYTGMLGAFAFYHGREIAATIAFVTFASLLAFYFFNKYPSRILPGDSLTYLLGAVLACIAILGDMEKKVIIAAIPFFIEFAFKLRGRLKKQSYGQYKDGKIISLYDKIYSLPHIFTIKGKFTEKQVVYFMILIELVFSSLIWVL